VSLVYAVASDAGRVRENNEDAALVIPERGLFVIADGMGGHAAGEVASAVATQTVVDRVAAEPVPRRIRDEAPILRRAAVEANAAVVTAAEERKLEGMGTTLTALLFRGRTAIVAHVGDTRAYVLLRSGKLRCLTRDHTFVGLLVRSGVLSEEAAMEHPDRHVLTQAIGTPDGISPEVVCSRIAAKSRLLLSTDGLHDVVPRAEIAELASDPSLETAVARLVERANERGGPDNVSVILVQT
jgi:protein phosphatase